MNSANSDIPRCIAVFVLGAAPSLSPEEAIAQADLFIDEARSHWLAGEHAESLTVAREALAFCETHLGIDHAKTLSVKQMVEMAAGQAPQ